MVCNLIKCAAVETSVRNQPCAEEMQLLRNVRQDSTLNTANPGLTKELKKEMWYLVCTGRLRGRIRQEKERKSFTQDLPLVKNKTKCLLFQIIWIALRCRSLNSCVSEAGLNGFQWGAFSPPWMHLLFYARHTQVSREHIIALWGNQRTSYCISRSRLIDFKKLLGRLSHYWIGAGENRNMGQILALCSWKGILMSSVQETVQTLNVRGGNLDGATVKGGEGGGWSTFFNELENKMDVLQNRYCLFFFLQFCRQGHCLYGPPHSEGPTCL